MYFGAQYEAVKTVDIKDWQALTDAERKSILSKYTTVYVNDYSVKTTYEYKDGKLAGQYQIPEASTGLWSWVTKTAEGLVNQAVRQRERNQLMPEKPKPPAPEGKKEEGFKFPEIPNWLLPVGLLVVAGIIIVPQLTGRKAGAVAINRR